MKEEIVNSNFDINEKYDDMIDTAKFIVDCYTLINDDGSEPPSHICLAYDVKNYLPKLLEENKSLQSQLKAKEEVATKLKEWLEEMLNGLKQNDVYDRTSYELGQIITIEYIITKIEELEKIQELEILSKGENK